MTLTDIEQSMIAQFGTSEVNTRDVIKALNDLGSNAATHYPALRLKYSAGHGVLQFKQATRAVEESDSDISARINSRFAAMDTIVRATAKGLNRALIISGPAGVGKSFGVEKAVKETIGDFTHIKGYVRATGLFKQLYANRHSKNTIVFDDTDCLFSDENSLNLLKCVCDSSDTRRVSWLSEAVMESEDGETLPKSFDFCGNIIFITNKDFQQMATKDTKLSPHIEAMMSRSMYVDIGVKSVRDYLIRIKQVIDEGMLDNDIRYEDQQDLMHYLKVNANNMQELSLRMVKKLASLINIDATNWKELAKIVCQKS